MHGIILTLILSLPPHPQGDMGGPFERHGMWMIRALTTNEALQERLGLSEEQIEAIKNLHFDIEKQIITISKERDLKELELRKLLSEDNPDMKQIESLVKEISSLEADIRIARIRELIGIRSTLTKEQMEKLRAEIGKFRKRMIREKMRD